MKELEIQFEEERESECWGSPLSVYCAKCLFKVLCETRNRDQIKMHTDKWSVW